MKLGKAIATVAGASAGLLLYGALVEVHKLEVTRKRLRLRRWPTALNGLRVGFLSDFHICDAGTIALTQRAVAKLLEHEPDLILLGGDFVHRWTAESLDQLEAALGGLANSGGRVFAVPGNRDYLGGYPELLEPLFRKLGIKLLRNDVAEFNGVQIVGIDSANASQADPIGSMELADAEQPTIVLWHEPDLVDWVPDGADLMLSGHSHGGQFTTPWGYAPVTSKNGRRYLRGYFPDAATPLYVNRGLGTTGPPSRLFCRPEVTILDLVQG
ncbi:MAG: metallophosphoesterase [Chthonomonas sp.]|nr:metallophosphoesterase [Chthonomonas sp.]